MKLILLVSGAADTTERMRQLCPPEYSLIEAPDAAEAIGFLRTTVVDLVLVDLAASAGRWARCWRTLARPKAARPSWACLEPACRHRGARHRSSLYEWVELPGIATKFSRNWRAPWSGRS